MKRNVIMLVVLVMVFGANIWAVEENLNRKDVAEVMMGSYGLSWNPKVSFSKLVLTVSSPTGAVIKKTFDAGTVPGFDLTDLKGSVMDGFYNYQLTVIPAEKVDIRNAGNLTKAELQIAGGLNQSGGFLVKGGSIVLPSIQEPGSDGISGAQQDGISSTMDNVINDDLIVTFSACIGSDCVNGESFGFDTLRLKENNLRIKFQDTSSSASFPTNDWQLTANDSSNGGAEKFSIDDITNGKTPFTVEANTPSNTLYVDSTGRVGFGTNTPVVNLHVKEGNTPTLRLEQDGSSGFTPQTWDLAGNETNFFIRDVTNGSKLAFRIQPSSPESTLTLRADGRIGHGTWAPSYRFHQKTDSSTNAQFVAERASGAKTIVAGTASLGYVGTLSNHTLRFSANDSYVMDLNPPGATNDLEMANGAVCTSAGVWTNASSRELKENIKSLNADDAMKTLKALAPVTYNYKRQKEEQYVGFIAEDVPDLVAVNGRKGLASMDVVAVLTKVVQKQQETIELLKKKIESIEKKETK
jgi:Chaperone of endosialidase